MKSACLWTAFAGLAAAMLCCVAAVEFEGRQLQAANGYYYNDGPEAAAESSRIHHGKLKQKKLKKRLLLQCLLGQGQRRRRRDTETASGRFLLPVVLQSTNVNVGSGSGGGGGGGYGDDSPQQQYGSHGGGGCMQILNGHGPLLGSLGSLGSPMEDSGLGGSRNGLQYADWNRYGRQFHRNFVRPLYRLF